MNNESKKYFGESTMQYAQYNFEKYGYQQPPPPSFNGGLYSGEPFVKGSAWATVPVPADSTYQKNVAMLSAGIPEAARMHYGYTRDGNNYVATPGVEPYRKELYSINCPKLTPQEPCVCTNNCNCQKCYNKL
jgi:hypothetical protein